MTGTVFPDLKDRSVFITGGASGIGAAITEGFVAQGAKVAFADIEPAEALCDEIAQRHGQRPLAMSCDVTDTESLRATLAQAAEANGPIRTLVNLAAFDERHRTEDVTPEYWRHILARNLDHVFFATQAVIPGMRAAGGGTVVMFSSISYQMPMGDYPGYTASKAAINTLARTMAREFGPDNIRINAIQPGWVRTPRQVALRGATPEALAAFQDQQCLKRVLVPEDMVGPVLFLSSEASSVMTGQALVVDGGVVITG